MHGSSAQQAVAADRQSVLTVVDNRLGRDAVLKLNFGTHVYVDVPLYVSVHVRTPPHAGRRPSSPPTAA